MRNSGEAWRGKSRWGHDFILVARKIFWADTWAECNERDAMQITGRREIPRQEEWHVKSPSGRSRVGIFKEQWEGQVTMVKRARVHVVEVWSERWEGSGPVGPCSLRQGLRLLFQVWWAASLCIFLIWCCIKVVEPWNSLGQMPWGSQFYIFVIKPTGNEWHLTHFCY